MRAAWAAVVVFLLLFQGAVACRGEPQVIIVTQGGRRVAFQVEVADTPAKRERGLQYRRELPEGGGMIFLFPVESRQSFWMKNTPIPLDIIFIDRNMKIVGIVEQATPFSLDARAVASPSLYVLEINGGLARRHGIRPGDSVSFEGISAHAVTE